MPAGQEAQDYRNARRVMTPPDARPAAIGGSAVPGRPEPRSVDDEGLPRPPPVHGKLSRWLLHGLAQAESVTFMAIAMAVNLISSAVVVVPKIECLPDPRKFEIIAN